MVNDGPKPREYSSRHARSSLGHRERESKEEIEHEDGRWIDSFDIMPTGEKGSSGLLAFHCEREWNDANQVEVRSARCGKIRMARMMKTANAPDAV